jgi:uncharacterized alkaline shock family protein YloU
VSIRYGRPLADAVQEVRDAVAAAVRRHGELRVSEIDVTVEEVHVDGES